MDGRLSSKMDAFAPWLLVIVGVVVYANSLSGPFVFDDLPGIVENGDIRQLWPLWRAPGETDLAALNGRPVVRFSLALNYALGGLDARGYRIANIAVHILCALVLYDVVRRTLRSTRLADQFGHPASVLALVCALLWLVHPLHTECVNYVG